MENQQLIKKDDIAALDRIAASALTSFSAGASFEDAFAVADAMNSLRSAITDPMMDRFMALQNSPLGFLTDRDPSRSKPGEEIQPYSKAIVKDVVIEMTLRGLKTVGNQFNLIAKRGYITKEGYHFLLKKIAGLTDLRPTIGVPVMREGGALVPCEATWKMNGKEDSLKCTIPVRTDKYSGADQILGKAQRKLLARIHSQITGQSENDGDATEVPQISETARPNLALADEKELADAGLAPKLTSVQSALSSGTVSASTLTTPAATATKKPTIQERVIKNFEVGGTNFDQFKAFLVRQDALTQEQADQIGDLEFLNVKILERFGVKLWPDVIEDINAFKKQG